MGKEIKLVKLLYKETYKVFFLLTINISLACNPAYALQNSIGIHDPSSIVKDSDTYWIFGTHNVAIYSNDLIKWSRGKWPYTPTTYPTWISDYVPLFAGDFWAPECIYMNGTYHLYYACSTFGSRISCIGLATSSSLNNPVWTDQGVVKYSNNSTAYNCIDPDIFYDADGKVWLSFGSWSSGINMLQLDSLTGKPLNTTVYSVCTFSDAENSQVMRNDTFYYLFANRGLCCKGSASTYYIQVGRSTNPTGPYSGWRTVLSSSGNFIGPGAIGHYSENGVEWATFHYYDKDNNGSPTLAIGQLKWTNGWPVITLNWLDSGCYKITNVNNGLVWQDWSCTGNFGTEIIQRSWENYGCQVWNLSQVGNGYYEIASALGEMAVTTNGCKSTNGIGLQLAPYNGDKCQIFHIERSNVGNYVLSIKTGIRVVEVPNATSNDTVLSLASYKGTDNQKWMLDTLAIDTISGPKLQITSIKVYTTNNDSIISVANGSLKMLVSITPFNLSFYSVDWTVSDTSLASINETGLLTARKDGKVIVKAIAKDGSGISDSMGILISGQVAVKMANIERITIFPNPVIDGRFSIQFNNQEISKSLFINISDLQGKSLYKMSLNRNELSNINVNLQAGVYLVQIMNNNRPLIQKLMVK